MGRFCQQCGMELEPKSRFCVGCGAPVEPEAPAGRQRKEKKQKEKNPGSKKALVAWIVVLAVVGLIVLAVFAFGNYITLAAHTNKVLASLNSGNLDLSEFQVDPYKDIPLYVVEMIGDTGDVSETGPIVEAMIPYLRFERTKIHGFFGGREVEYCITSRDLSAWILDLDYSTVSTTEELQQMLIEQIPAAPQKAYYVTIRYEKDGLFDWKGDYETMEFADAISGGMNTAYNALYARMLKELEDLLG